MRALLVILAVLMPVMAMAVTLDKPLPDHAMEMRAQHMFAEMRCVVCEGQPLAESDARHAVDMRATIRQMMVDGDSDDTIRDFFHGRYGDSVFMRPPVRGAVTFLWLAPFIMLAMGISIVFTLRRRKEG